MAASDARPVPRKNAAFRLYFAIRKNDGTLITTWTGADSEVSLDGAAFSDCTNEATEIGTSGCGYLDLTAGEMNADSIVYKLTVTNTDALPLVITLFPEESGDYRIDSSTLATAADLSTVDTVVDAIKVKTDQFVFTVANQVDSNALSGGGGLDAAGVRAAVGLASANLDTQLGAIVTDTNELQTDLVNGGRLDNILDSRASQSSVDAIATSIASLVPAATFSDAETVNSGTVISGTFASTATDDNVRYVTAPTGTGLSFDLSFPLGINRAPTSVAINGYWNGSGQVVDVLAYDYHTLSWRNISNSTTRPVSRTTDTNYVYVLSREFVSDAGVSLIRFTSTSTNATHRLHLDRVLVYSIAETASEGGGLTAQNVWEYSSRVLTSVDGEPADYTDRFDSIDTQVADLPTNAELATALGTGTWATALPWNAAWDAEVESECTDALAAYDPPTKAELDSAVAPLALESSVQTVDTVVDAIKAKTDQFVFTVANQVDANALTGGGGGGLDAAGVRAAVGLASANLDTQLGDIPTNAELATALGTADDATLAAIAALNNLSSAQVVSALGTGTWATALPWNAAWDTEVQSECADALAAYDPPTKAELDSAVAPLALETSVQTVDTVADAIKAKTDQFVFTIANQVDANALTGGGGGGLDAAGVRAAVGLSSANLDTQLADLPTNAELAAATSGLATASSLATVAGYLDTEIAAILEDTGTTLPAQIAAIDATAANQLTIIDHLEDIKGDTFSESTDSLEAIRDRGDAAWVSITTGVSQAFTTVRRGTSEDTPIYFTFPVGSLANNAFTKTRRIDGGSSNSVTGAVTYLYLENGDHWYKLEYNAADRPSGGTEGVVQYLFTSGSDSVGVELLVSDTDSGPAVVVVPTSANSPDRTMPNTIPLFVGERMATPVPVFDANGDALSLVGKTLVFKVETQQREPVLSVVPDISSNTFTFTPNSQLTSSERVLLWCLWESDDKVVIAEGKMPVKYTPKR